MEKAIFKCLFLFFFLFPCVIYGNNVRFYPINLTQPNGLEIHVFVSGNEFYNWVHDGHDYTIVKNPDTGYFVYAVRGQNGDLIPSFYIVGLTDPTALDLAKGLKQPWEIVGPQINRLVQMGLNNPSQPAPKTGTINNLVIFIRFSDETEFTDPRSTFDSFFNNSAAGANSMYNYFKEASYSALSVSTTFYPIPPGSTVVSYQDSHPRAYYQPYDATTNPLGYADSQRAEREHTLLKNAATAVASQVPVGLNIDGDNDGYVDNVCFIVSGDTTAWATLLWPHMWSLYSYTVNINGKRVYTYNFQLRNFLNARGVGVLCHEMCHSLGAPDLYHYSYDGLSPTYSWDIMEQDHNPPQHMGAYMKYKYMGWIASLNPITPAPGWGDIYAGTYSLNPLTSSTNNCYKIPSPYSASEYFVVEYRKKTGTFENSIPGTGLLIYRINSTKTGNAQGPPDEVYIYRPNGTLTANGQPQNANYSVDVGRTAINDGTNPSSFLSTGASGGLNISSVSSAGATISFSIGPPIIVPPNISTSPVSAIGTVNAVSGGTVLSDGGAAVTARGVCWSITVNPTTSNSKTNDGTGTGIFTSTMTGLSTDTTYHVRAYATNSAGTAYGADVTFKTASTAYIIPFIENFVASTMPASWTTQNIGSGITERWSLSNSAQAGGAPYEMMCAWIAINPGTMRLVTPGIKTLGYSSLNLSFKHFFNDYAQGVTLKIQTSTNGATWTDEPWSLASGGGNVGPATVDTTITHNLNSAITFVAFVVTGDLYEFDYWYLDDISITLLNVVPPTVTTTGVTGITQTVATSGGTVTSDGGAAVTARGVCWSTLSNPTISNSKTTDGTGTGGYASSMTGLSANTTYHVRAYATSTVGTAYGSDLSFTTLLNVVPPTVSTTAASSVTQTSAMTGGNVTADGGAAVTERGVCVSISANPTVANAHTHNGSGTGAFASSLTDCTPATTYHVRAYATNSIGTAYGSDLSFTTSGNVVPPTVTTTATSSITTTSAVTGGNVTSAGSATVTERGVCVATTPNPTIANAHTHDGAGTGVFTSSLTGCTPGETYHVRAYATSTAGTAYGNDIWFQTLGGSKSDFNRDGQSDILWRNMTTGENAVWFMGYTMSGVTNLQMKDLQTMFPGAGPVRETGDLFKGKPGTVYRTPQEGIKNAKSASFAAILGGPMGVQGLEMKPATSISPFQGGITILGLTRTSVISLPSLTDLNWVLAGTGDFNGDGWPDFVLRNMVTGENGIWYIVNGTKIGAEYMPSVLDLNWKIVGTGDFNRDKKPDLVWRNNATGENFIWFMNGAARIGGDTPPSVTDQNWTIVGTGDFNGDGKPDFLWHNAVTGENYIWFMDGATRIGGDSPPMVSDVNWQIGGVDDFNADGRPDILWRNYMTGENGVWYMNGALQIGAEYVPTIADLAWKIVNR